MFCFIMLEYFILIFYFNIVRNRTTSGPLPPISRGPDRYPVRLPCSSDHGIIIVQTPNLKVQGQCLEVLGMKE